jgi:hypothetical protein
MAESQSSDSIRVESVNWSELLPFTRIFGSFKIAVDPPKLMMSLLLVVLLFISGKVLDGIWGGRVFVPEASGQIRFDEITEYTVRDRATFKKRLAIAWDDRRERIAANRDVPPLAGVFSTALRYKLDSFDSLVTAATSLNFGLTSIVSGDPPLQPTVVGALYRMFVVLPGWLWTAHAGFLVTYVLIGLVLWSFFGGAICRLAASHAAAERHTDPGDAVVFARERWVWFFAAPLLPALITGVIVLVLAVGGLVFFNLPGLDILGALVFGLALVLGVVAALLLIGFGTGVHLMYPALAVEGTDGFDAVSRSFNYVFSRPWRWLFYTGVALVYGAITYLFISLIVFLTVWLTHRAVGWWVIAQVGEEAAKINRFDAMLVPPQIGDVIYDIQWDQLPATGKAAAGIMWVWIMLLLGLMPAYAISYYFASHTWIYLLLRRSADGTDLTEHYVEPTTPTTPAPVTAPAAAATEAPPPPPAEGAAESPPPPN